MVRSLLWFMIFIVVAAGVAGIAVSMRASTPQDTQVVTVGSIRRIARGSGRVEGAGEMALFFFRPGRVEKVNFQEGEDTDPDDILVELNSSDIDVQIEQAEAALKEAQAKLELTKKPPAPEVIQQAQEKVRQASDDVKAAKLRLKALEEPAVPPPAQAWQTEEQSRRIERAKQHVLLAEVTLKKLKAQPTADQLAIAERQVSAAETDLENAKKILEGDKSGNSVIPFGGPSQKTQLQANVERAKRKLELEQAVYDQVKRGAAPEDIEEATNRVALAQKELEIEQSVLERLLKPVAPPRAPEYEIEAARVALSQAQAQERQALAALEAAKRGPEKAEIDGAEAACQRTKLQLDLLKLNKEGLKLRSTGGLVVRRFVEPGGTVAAFAPVMTILDFSKKKVRAEFDVSRLADIKPGMPVALSSRALAKEISLDGKVEKIIGVGTRKLAADDPAAPKGGEVVEVLISVEAPKTPLKEEAFKILRPGLRVDADITLERRDNVISAPKSFISQEASASGIHEFVWMVTRGNTAGKESISKKQVKCGLRDEAFVEILEGLSEGDVIAKPQAANLR